LLPLFRSFHNPFDDGVKSTLVECVPALNTQFGYRINPGPGDDLNDPLVRVDRIP
jgi:hypothetical protein